MSKRFRDFKRTYPSLVRRARRIGVLVVALAVQPVLGAQSQPDPGDRLAELDADGNGTVSREEFRVRATIRFAEIDVDGDGGIDRDEMTAAAPPDAGRMMVRLAFSRQDRNNDRRITPDEHLAGADESFARIDANADGVLSVAELRDAADRRR